MRKSTVGLIGICLLTFFLGLGSPAIGDSDEAFYAESAREMVEGGDWLTPHFNYEYRFEKPVLYYWLVALSFVVAGVGEAAARFPSALAGLGLVFLTFGCARQWYGESTGFLAAMITATSFGCVAMARQALPDLTLAFFITLATWAALAAWLDLPPEAGKVMNSGPSRRGWVLLAAVGAAGGLLTKGPVAIVLPVLIFAPLIAWEYMSGRSRPHLRKSDLLIAVLVVIVLAAPWFLGMTLVHGTPYLERFFIGENLERFSTARYNNPRPLWYYLPIVVGGMFPWSPFMLLWVRPLTRGLRQHLKGAIAGTRLIWWAVAPLLFYTLSVGKQPRYILPIIPPLAILLARTLQQHLAGRDKDRMLAVCTGITAFMLCGIATLVYRASPLLAEWNSAWITGIAIAVGLSAIGVILSITRAEWTPAAVIAASVIVSISAHMIVLSSPGSSPVERIADLLQNARSSGEPYGRYRVLNRNLIFYTRDAFQELTSEEAVRNFIDFPERVLTVLPAQEIQRLNAQGVTTYPIGEVRYLNTGGLTLEMLLNPDPSRYLLNVLLVSNELP